MSDRLTDDEMMKMVREQADELESCAAAMRAAGAEIDRLRLALETAERERGEIAVCADGWMKRVAAAERERDEARVALEKSRRTIYFTWRDVEACREGLSISADIKGDTLEEVVRFLLNERDALLSRPAPPADAAPLTSDFHTSCDWCKRDIPNACYAVLCSDCDRRGNTALFAPPADAAETPGTNKVEASDGDRDHKGADLKQDGGGNAADGEGPALLGVQQADGALPDGAAGRVLLAVSVLRGGAADRSVAPPADAATEAVREAIEAALELLYSVRSARKGSIGSIDNTYLPQIGREWLKPIEERIEAGAKALAARGGAS